MPSTPSTHDFGPSTQQFDAASARDALPSGTRLGGYQIIDVLGRGGFGVVYLALDSSLQRQVAIKEYLPTDLATRGEGHALVLKPGTNPADFAAGLAAFLNEAKLLARFDHPSLARVHSFWEENATAYMVMPYYHGHTLTATLKAMPHAPDEAWLRALLTPLLSALNVLHGAQCYHRDISPDNIFVLADGRPVLLDFGAANRVAGDKTLPLTALLNPAYAPIEQYSESATLPQGPWTDLYALAGVLHFAITGQPPARATVRAVDDPQRPLAETVRTLRATVPGPNYSESFLAGIDKALAVKPRDRPRHVGDFQQWLDRTSQAAEPPRAGTETQHANTAGTRNEPVFDVPPAREEWFTADAQPHLGKPVRNHAPLWIAALGAVALAALGGWWWTQQASPVPPPAMPSIAAAELPASAIAPLSASAAMASDATASAAAPLAAASQAAPAASAASEPAIAMVAPSASAVTAPPAAEPSSASAVAAAAPPVVEEPAPEPAAKRKASKLAANAEADNPRGVCGPRSNFSLVYCMQTQCKRAKFAQHPQCTDLRQRGDIN